MKVYSLTKTLDDLVDFYIDEPTEAEVIVVGGGKIELEKYPKLKYIFKCGVGVDNIPDLEGTGIELILPSITTRNSIYDEVSCFTINSILSCHYKNLGSVDSWTKNERVQLSNKKSLVFGSKGNIGKRVYGILEKLTPDILGYDVIDNFYAPIEYLQYADIITFHCPLTEENKSMINTDWLKEDVILINTARAELIDEDALYEFLKNNPKATAAFDVFWEEPYKGKLLELENFIATPHVASFGDGFKKGLYNDLMELIK